ncbi:MAG: hypothetical protein ACRDS0_33970, partial [Pseudonocardiaceae bacterium]
MAVVRELDSTDLVSCEVGAVEFTDRGNTQRAGVGRRDPGHRRRVGLAPNNSTRTWIQAEQGPRRRHN